MVDSPAESVRLVIPSDPYRIAEVDEFLERHLRERGVSETLVTDLAIATTELVNNAIVHGNKQDLSKIVTLSVLLTSTEVEIRVTDQGEIFDPEAIPDPLAEENLLKEVGRGIFIVRALMDSVEYGRGPDGGNVVVVRKSLTSE